MQIFKYLFYKIIDFRETFFDIFYFNSLTHRYIYLSTAESLMQEIIGLERTL